MKTTIKHKSTGNIYVAEIYTSFVYLVEEMRTVTIEEYNDYFEVVSASENQNVSN